jgi:hypothetical protein
MVDFSVQIASRAHERVMFLVMSDGDPETLDNYIRALKNAYDAISIHYYLAMQLQGCDQSGSVNGEIPTTLDNLVPTITSPGNNDLESD